MFDEYRGRQYERELLFSTVVDIVALVALGLQPSVHVAARSREGLHVSHVSTARLLTKRPSQTP
jgi:hypothetical protein